MPEPHRSAHDGYLNRYSQTGQTHILNSARRFDAQRKDGSVFPIELSVSRSDVPARTTPLFVGIIRDMTGRDAAEREAGRHEGDDERSRLQAALTEQTAALEAAHPRLRLADRLASIGTLAAGLGHDMNNVLLAVRARLNGLKAAKSLADVRAHARPSPRASRTSEVWPTGCTISRSTPRARIRTRHTAVQPTCASGGSRPGQSSPRRCRSMSRSRHRSRRGCRPWRSRRTV